jgi:hypothetical protein
MDSTEKKEHDFSIELKYSKSLTSLSTNNNGKQGVLIEGTLGKHIKAAFLEPTILEVQGESGILRLSICKEEITFPKDAAEEV